MDDETTRNRQGASSENILEEPSPSKTHSPDPLRPEKSRLRKEQQALLENVRMLVSQPTSATLDAPLEDIQKLQKSCDEASTEADKLMEEVSQIKSQTSEVKDLGRNINLVREKLLKGLAQAYKDAKPLVFPLDSNTLQLLALAELEKTNEELSETLAWMKSHRELYCDRLAKEQQLLSEREEISKKLEAELRDLLAKNAVEHPEEVILSDIKNKDDSALKYLEKLKNFFCDFTQEHFPPPDPEEVRLWRAKNKIGPEVRLFSLLDILEELMNRVIDTPNNPWVLTDKKYWPPYVQLLVRVGTVQRHPDDDHRIKMTPYHL